MNYNNSISRLTVRRSTVAAEIREPAKPAPKKARKRVRRRLVPLLAAAWLALGLSSGELRAETNAAPPPPAHAPVVVWLVPSCGLLVALWRVRLLFQGDVVCLT